jgi:hypothetical protein
MSRLLSPAYRAGVACGLLLAVAVLLAGNATAAAVDWGRAHLAVISTDHGPVVVEEGTR